MASNFFHDVLVYRLWFFFFHPFVLHISYCVFLLLSFFFVCLFCLWEGAWQHAALGGVAFVSSLRRENSNVFSDWEGCGVTNDINERLMQTHIIFFIPFPNAIFLKIVWSFWQNNDSCRTGLAQYYIWYILSSDETILNKFLGFFLSKYWGWEKMSYNFENLQFSQIKQICWDDSF